jgi:hypothetical protein
LLEPQAVLAVGVVQGLLDKRLVLMVVLVIRQALHHHKETTVDKVLHLPLAAVEVLEQ